MQRNKKKMRMEKGITLVALVVTIIVLIILATISINVIFSENGILERAIQGQEDYNKGQAREKLVLALGDLAVDKQINEEYDENDFIDNALENQGMIVNGNIVIVDGWQFEIDRSVPEIVEELGKGEENKDIQISVTSTTSSDYTKATIKVEITYEGELSSLKIGEEEITELTKEDGKYVIEVDVTDNKTYTILAKDAEDNYRLEKVEVKDVSTDLDIYTKEQLVAFRDRVNNGATYEGRTVRLMADIDLNKGKYEVKEDGTITFKDAEQWTPIANYGVNNTLKFSGTFEGNNYTISGLYINGATTGNQGLFGLNTGTIKDLILENANINSTADNVGILIGSNNPGTISNVKASGMVSSTGKCVGGIVGYSKGTITQTINNAIVSGTDRVGGIVGANSSGTISYCYNRGPITGSIQAVGGITGYNYLSDGTISYCYNKGPVTGQNGYAVGGIVGVNNASTIQDCYNRGNITSTGHNGDSNSFTGGISGSNYNNATIESCYNTGNVTASYVNVGGIIGWNGSTNGTQIVKNVFNTGTIKKSSTAASSNIGKESDYVGYLIGRWGSLSGKYGNTTLATMSVWTSETIETNLSSEFINDEKNDKGEWIYNDGYPILKWQAEK